MEQGNKAASLCTEKEKVTRKFNRTCLKKIRAIPIQEIVPTDDLEGTEIEKKTTEYLEKTSRKTSSIWKLPKLFAKGPKENDE